MTARTLNVRTDKCRIEVTVLCDRIRGVADLDQEIAAYEQMQGDLEAHNMGQWVLIHDRQLVSTYDSFEKAAEDAVGRFGRGPFLIRQVGAPPVTLPASVMYRLDYGRDKLRF